MLYLRVLMMHCGGWLLAMAVIGVACQAAGDEPTDADSQPRDAFPDPVERNIEGWVVKITPGLLEPENEDLAREALAALANHLQRVRYIVPPERLTRLREMPLWLDLEHAELGSMQYHPSRDWLISHGHDPRLAKHVHIPQARHLTARHMWAKHPYVVLHELAHAYHDQVLGFDDPEIIAAFERARDSGSYDEVLLHTGRTTRHYGLTNHKEYFAESTEAYFGVNDFYPFVRAELERHDPTMFALMQNIWGPVE